MKKTEFKQKLKKLKGVKVVDIIKTSKLREYNIDDTVIENPMILAKMFEEDIKIIAVLPDKDYEADSINLEKYILDSKWLVGYCDLNVLESAMDYRTMLALTCVERDIDNIDKKLMNINYFNQVKSFDGRESLINSIMSIAFYKYNVDLAFTQGNLKNVRMAVAPSSLRNGMATLILDSKVMMMLMEGKGVKLYDDEIDYLLNQFQFLATKKLKKVF